MNWSVDECIDKFKAMCQTAFTPRSLGEIPGIGLLVQNYNHSRYRTTPLQATYKEAFTSNRLLFGGEQTTGLSPPPVKIAVTSTSLTGTTPIVIGKYNRECAIDLPYKFERYEKARSEMRIWEAARATSAAPMFSRAFYHERTGNSFIDGALYHNNPIKIAE